MGRIGLGEIIFVGLVVLILFGSKRLPEIGRALGKALKEFKKAGKEVQDQLNETGDDEK